MRVTRRFAGPRRRAFGVVPAAAAVVRELESDERPNVPTHRASTLASYAAFWLP